MVRNGGFYVPRRASNLQKRGNVFWLRVRVPDDLRDSVGKTEIRKSLKTSDLIEAECLDRVKRIELDAEWTVLRRKRSGPVESLSKSELWYLASKAFIEYEEHNQQVGSTPLFRKTCKSSSQTERQYVNAATVCVLPRRGGLWFVFASNMASPVFS